MIDTPNLDLSVVIPLYNEAENIAALYEQLGSALIALGHSYEVVVVDDGSRDDSFARLKALHQQDSRWRVIRFRRNFGQTAAMAAGFDAARGAIIITIDADLQNDPNDIAKLLDKMNEGYDVVSGWRMNRKEPFFSRRLPSMLANGLISRTTGISLHDYGCTLKAYRSEVAKSVELYGELHRFIPALASSIGITIAEVPVNDRPRQFGSSKYGISRTFRVMLDLMTVIFLLSYGTRPLHVFGGLGLFSGGVGSLLLLYLGYVRLILGENIGNRPLLLLAVLFVILGVQMIGMGLMSEMITRAYHESRNKPIYAIREQLDSDQAS